MIYAFKNLPEDVVRIIYAFCIDKREHWDKVTEQFFKGGFNRNNLRILSFIREQKKLCRRFWSSNRLELTGFTQWNSITRRRELCPFDYRFGEWNIKNKSVVVCFTTGNGYISKFSGKNPVSTWLKNINKFETVASNTWVYMYSGGQKALLDYLPKEKNNFGIKFQSAFYKKRYHMLEKKRKKRAHLEKANLFIEERRKLKKMCGFEQGQQVILSFNMPVPIMGTTLKFYRGSVVQIFLKQHRDNGRLIFSKPKGKYEFDNEAVDNYIGEIQIKIQFEDGEHINYTSEKLASRIEISNKELGEAEKGDFIRGWLTLNVKMTRHHLEKITISGTQYYLEKVHSQDESICILDEKFNIVGRISNSQHESHCHIQSIHNSC
uniref:Uncharacterized protein n=1 Tax=viral metagenome TaxID=1070528 RepID=A0A6C0ENQ4_9ZZZZ